MFFLARTCLFLVSGRSVAPPLWRELLKLTLIYLSHSRLINKACPLPVTCAHCQPFPRLYWSLIPSHSICHCHSSLSNPFKHDKSGHFVPLIPNSVAVLYFLCCGHSAQLNENFPSLKLEQKCITFLLHSLPNSFFTNSFNSYFILSSNSLSI